MTGRLVELCVDAHDPPGLAGFWGAVLGRQTADDGVALRPDEDTALPIRFLPNAQPRTGLNQAHFDLTSASPEDQQRTVTRALELGATPLDVGQRPEDGHVVLADPEGNEFCVIEAGNRFLAGCGRLGALSSDGTAAVGRFWSAALGWPLVWDQDEETAVQSPRGGVKITWGGPPVRPKTARNRLHLHVAPPPDVERAAEVQRLVALGAVLVTSHPDRVAMLDPDGNEFCAVPPP